MRRAAALLLALALALPAGPPARAEETTAQITWYDLEGPMADGVWVHIGAAACTDDLGMGTTVIVFGEAELCEDRFAPAYQHSPTRVDVWGRPDMTGCEDGCAITVIR